MHKNTRNGQTEYQWDNNEDTFAGQIAQKIIMTSEIRQAQKDRCHRTLLESGI